MKRKIGTKTTKIPQGNVNSGQRTSTTRCWKRGKRRLQRIENKEIKSVIFVPHTRKSGLATELREQEQKLQEVTGERIKIVEKAGRKLENILAGRDPWKGKDCGRENCFLCNTKILTGKDLNRDCTKRNILYEIRCLSCEKQEREKLTDGDKEKEKDLLKNMEIPKYIGESSRSAYERGYEHLDKLATLSSQSHMLKHQLDKHEHLDMKSVQWGMFILDFKRSAFERQISEAVTIHREARNKNIWIQKQSGTKLLSQDWSQGWGQGNKNTKNMRKNSRKKRKLKQSLKTN